MLSKTALTRYLERELASYSWIKQVDRESLEQHVTELPAQPKLKAKLFLHQLAAFYIGACLKQFLYFLDLGTGKTLLSLALVSYWKQLQEVDKVLVIVPNVVNIEEWKLQVAEFTDFSTVPLHGTKAQRMQAIRKQGDIYVINYDGLQSVMTELEAVKGSRGRRKRVPKQDLITEFTKHFQMVVFDEAHRAKSSSSLTYRLCTQISKVCKYRYALTGTPFGRNPMDFWAQFQLIDHGETLGSFNLFRSAFFTGKPNYFGGLDWNFNNKKKRLLYRIIQNKSLRYADSECQELPPVTHTVIKTPLTKDAFEYYKILRQQAEGADEEKQRENYYSKFRQIASGFVYIKDEEEQVRQVLHFANPAKLDMLQELIEKIPDAAKMVVFHIFDETGKMIGRRLTEMKVNFAAINSTEKNHLAALNKFKTDSACAVLVVNIASGNSGLNLQVARYVCFYEPTDRPIWQRQAEKRVHRTGQTQRVIYYHFISPVTVEEKIRQFLLEGKSLFDALVEGKIKIKDL